LHGSILGRYQVAKGLPWVSGIYHHFMITFINSPNLKQRKTDKYMPKVSLHVTPWPFVWHQLKVIPVGFRPGVSNAIDFGKVG